MTAPTATLVLYGKVPDLGWRRGSIVFAKNGLPKLGVLLLSTKGTVTKKETPATNLAFQIRTYVDRQAHYVSVGTDYKEAVALLERMQDTRQREALDAKLGITLPKSAEELEAERQSSRKTLAQAKEKFLAKKTGLSRHSDALYRVIGDFIKFTGKTYMDELTEDDVKGFYDSLKKDYAQRTRQTRYMALRGFLKASGVNLADLIDDATHKQLRKKPDQNTEPYTDEQTQRLLAVCDPYYKMVYTLLLSTGLRMQEAMNLTWTQIKWDTNQIVVKGEQEIHHAKMKKVVKFTTKTLKGRTIPLFASLKVMLEDWRQQHPDTIFVLGTKSDLPNTHWLEYLKDYARAAKLNCGMCKACSERNECEHFFLHKFRHTFAVRCLEKFSIHQVSKWMGHHDLSVTSIYLSGTPKDADSDPFTTPKPVSNDPKVVAIDYKEAV